MTDLISRQAAIEIASGFCHPANIAKELERLPSAQPELSDEEKRLYKKLRSYHNGSYAKLLDKMMASAQPESELISWILDKVWDEEQWELNWQAFPELVCRKLTKLGYVREKDGEYERLDR